MIAERCLAAALVAALALSPARAGAQGAAAGQASAAPRAAGAARAEALFVEGRALYDARRYDIACDKLAESDRLEPRVGTRGLLASCLEHQGRLATAYQTFQETAALARALGDERGRFAVERAAVLKPHVPTLRVRVAAAAPGLRITRDGAPVGDAQLEQELLVDPGAVTLSARAPGRIAWSKTVHLEPDARAVVDVPELAPAPAPAARVVRAEPAPQAAPDRGADTRRALGFVAGGIGIVGLGVGAGFGLMALSRSGASDTYCDARDRCTPEGGALREEARTAAGISTAGFGIGVAGLGAGAILLLTSGGAGAPSSGKSSAPSTARIRVAPSAGPGGAGAVVTGRF